MNGTAKAQMYKVSLVSPSELFAEAVQNGQISFITWHKLMAEPLNSTFSQDDEDVITRLIYAVRRGLVKVVD